MHEYMSDSNQIRKKVFFKPQLSTEIKYNSMISPQFTNDTNILYMSAYDFISYNTDEEAFNLIHRPLPPDSTDINSLHQQKFINVNFGRESRQRINEIFYVIKTIQNEQQVFCLGRRMNSVNYDHSKKIIARGRNFKKKKITFADLDRKCNIKQQKQSLQTGIPSKVIDFQKQFIVKQPLSLLIFVIKRQISKPQVPDTKQVSDSDSEKQMGNNSPPGSETQIQEEVKEEPVYKNCLLIHSYLTNQTITFQLDESIQSAFETIEGNSNIVCITQKAVYLLSFEGKIKMSPSDTCLADNENFQYGEQIKVCILDKFELDFYIKNDKNSSRNSFKNSSSKASKRKRYNSVLNISLIRDRRVSKMLADEKRNSANMLSKFSANTPIIQEVQSEDACDTIKTIKKVLKILPLTFLQDEFVLIIYGISKVFCEGQNIETLSTHYQITILSAGSSALFEIGYEQKIKNNNNNNNEGFSSDIPVIQEQFANIMESLKEFGGISSNKGVILIWQKNEPTVHEIVFKVDYNTTQMLDLSEPKNLKTQKTIFGSINHILEYRNRISLHLNSNLINEIIISPNCHNFLILTGRSHLNNNYRESQEQYYSKDIKPDDIEEKYDINDYLIFQYDLFSELWSNDANVYLKNICNSYQKRRVDYIAPFRMKNQLLALSGKRVHQLHKSILDGILLFDLHPYGYFIAVSFGFNAKIYSLEHANLNLIYTYNIQNIKKIKYSPNGSDLVIMSQKSIKILDSYSFVIKYVLAEKSAQCCFTNFGYSFSGNHFYTVYDHVFINIQQAQSYTKLGSIKPGQNSLLNIHDKIVTIIPDSEQKFCLALLQKGSLYFKFHEDVVCLKHEFIYSYDDGMVIKSVHYDPKRKVLFNGLENGAIRAHIWPIKNQATYNFQTYAEFKFGYSEITALATSYLSNTLYIGDINGNLTVSKFIIEKQKKITGQVRGNNYLINSHHSPLVNMPKTQLQALQKCYKYVLSSSAISLAESPERLKLQYKLNEIITRMNEQMKRFKKTMREEIIQKETLARNKINFSKLYNDTKNRLSQVAHQIRQVKEKQQQQKTKLIHQYEQQLKNIIEQQNELVKEKGLELSKNFMGKTFLRQIHQNQATSLRAETQKIQGNSPDGINRIKLLIKQQQLVPYNQIDYLPNWKADIKNQYLSRLTQQLKKQHDRNYQLKQTCIYMQNSKNNLQMSRIKQQTLMFKINLQLQQMDQKLNYQRGIRQKISEELRQAEQKINKSQQQVVQRNPLFQRVVQGSSDDACTYKLWIKDRYTQEVELLHGHWNTIGDIMEQKQVDIVEMVNWKKKFEESIESMQEKKEKMKQYITFLRIHLSSLCNRLNDQKFSACNFEQFCDRGTERQKRVYQLERVGKVQAKKQISLKSKNKQRSLSGKRDLQRQLCDKQQAHDLLLKFSNNCRTAQILKTNQSLEDDLKTQDEPKACLQNRFVSRISDSLIDKYNLSKKVSQKSITGGLKYLKSDKRIAEESSTNFTNTLFDFMKKKEHEILKSSSQRPKTIDKVVAFSATCSPLSKQINSKTNMLQKTTKFLKNHVKIQQRKVKRLNGQKAQLLTQYQQLKYENKNLADKRDILTDGITIFKDIFGQTSSNWPTPNPVGQDPMKTSFQRYIELKSVRHDAKKNGAFKQNSMLTTRVGTMNSSRARHFVSAITSPRQSPRGSCKKLDINFRI